MAGHMSPIGLTTFLSKTKLQHHLADMRSISPHIPAKGRPCNNLLLQ